MWFGLITAANAQSAMPPPPDLSGLQPYPLLHLLGTLTVFALGTVAFIVSSRQNAKRGNNSQPVAEIHAEGPLSAGLKILERIAAAAERAVISHQDINSLRDEFGEKLADAKRNIYDRIDKHDDRIRETENLANRISGRLDNRRS